ncbi:MAG: hypothetical protein JNJ98_05205 [Gemmatimonadetes bacterium]|nr:hypothetical protein [Gemmatimonadota bacterium]
MTVDQQVEAASPGQAVPAAPPPPPAVPAIAGGAGAAGGGQATSAPAPVSCSNLNGLRSARNELSNQLNSVNNRREELVRELRSADPAAVPGLEARLKVLDARLVQIEQDIQTTGQQLVSAQQACAVVPVRGRDAPPAFWNSDVGEFAGVMGTLVLTFAAVRLIWTRTRPKPVPLRDTEADLRMERLEQAVDAIAIEVERVGEAQRFQARLLNEGAAQPLPVREREGERVRS